MPGKFEGGKTCDTPVSLIDLAPTFMNLANGSIATHDLDGEDLYDIMTGACPRDTVFGQLSYYDESDVVEDSTAVSEDLRNDDDMWRASTSTYMAVTKDWKYFYSAADEQEYLFDKVHDEKETRNTAGIVFNRDNLLDMRQRTMNFLKKGDEITGINGDQWKSFGKKSVSNDPDTGLLIQDTIMSWVKNEVPGYTTHALKRMF